MLYFAFITFKTIKTMATKRKNQMSELISFKITPALKMEAQNQFGKRLSAMLRDCIVENLDGAESKAVMLVDSRIKLLTAEMSDFDEILGNYAEEGDDSGCERMQRRIAQHRVIIDELKTIKSELE